jgi:hypothetical protein
MAREIPIGAKSIQNGLYLYEYTKTISGKVHTFREIYSAYGYHFYNVEQPENYNEEGELLPPNERVYAQYAILAQSLNTIEAINSKFISVPIADGYEVV